MVGNVSSKQLFDSGYKSPLSINVLSRARTTINGEVYKLAKNESTKSYDYTTENEITIEFKSSKEDSARISVSIQWVPFNVLPSNLNPTSSLVNDLRKLHHEGYDLRVSSLIQDSPTHCYTLNTIPEGNIQDDDTVKLSLAKAIPILNHDWFKLVYGDKDDVQQWFLDIDYSRYCPEKWKSLAIPDPKRAELFRKVTAFSFNEGDDFLETLLKLMGASIVLLKAVDYFKDGNIQVDKFRQLVNGEKCLFLEYNPKSAVSYNIDINKQVLTVLSKYGSTLTDRNVVETCLMDVSLQKLSFFNKRLKHDLDESSQLVPETRPRKRIKYEKVSKMHFFELDPTPPATELEEIPSSSPNNDKLQVPEPVPDSDIALVSKEVDVRGPGETSNDNDKGHERNPSKDVLEQSQEKSQTEEIHENEALDSSSGNVGLKRSISTSDQPKKIPKFAPKVKVSLTNAVKKAKEIASSEVNKDLGIEDNGNDTVLKDLSNLAIVETVDLPMRKPNKCPNDVDNEKYKGRKNFKKFKKNVHVKSLRTYVPLETVQPGQNFQLLESSETYNAATATEIQLEKNFNGLMNEVTVMGNGLFVGESDTEDTPASIFTDSRPVHEKESSVPESNRYGFQNISVDDDDDDYDDDAGPKFGFSRR